MKISIVKTAYAFVVLCGIIYAFVALRGPNGIAGLLDKRRQVHEYEMSNERLHREIEQIVQGIIARKKFIDHMLTIENTIRGLLKVHGLKLGNVHRSAFAAKAANMLAEKGGAARTARRVQRYPLTLFQRLSPAIGSDTY